jgi:hypothetical protein
MESASRKELQQEGFELQCIAGPKVGVCRDVDWKRHEHALSLAVWEVSHCGLTKITRSGFPWEKTTKSPMASICTHCKTAVGSGNV